MSFKDVGPTNIGPMQRKKMGRGRQFLLPHSKKLLQDNISGEPISLTLTFQEIIKRRAVARQRKSSTVGPRGINVHLLKPKITPN